MLLGSIIQRQETFLLSILKRVVCNKCYRSCQDSVRFVLEVCFDDCIVTFSPIIYYKAKRAVLINYDVSDDEHCE